MNINNRKNIQVKLEELDLLERIEMSLDRQNDYHRLKVNDIELEVGKLSVDELAQISRRLTDTIKNEIEKMKLEIKEELEKL